ncbi:MAG: hypothetical protein JWQ87_1340 [Candidatus Sulfotelmatobacter sp.]|nr:hypothetical protein [Candidatus Sulfotelmatobacter sp.]
MFLLRNREIHCFIKLGRSRDCTSDSKRRGQQAERQCDREVDDLEDSVDRNTQDTEWDQQEPDEWVGYQRQDRPRPAEYEEDAPEEER